MTGRRRAHVASIEALEEFKAQLAKVCETVRLTLDTALTECRKVEEVLRQELSLWRVRQRRWEDELALARAELNRIRMTTPPGEQPRDADAVAAVRRLKRKIARAEEAMAELNGMLQTAAAAREQLRKELTELRERVADDPPKPVIALEQILQRLEEYLRLQPPTSGQE